MLQEFPALQPPHVQIEQHPISMILLGTDGHTEAKVAISHTPIMISAIQIYTIISVRVTEERLIKYGMVASSCLYMLMTARGVLYWF